MPAKATLYNGSANYEIVDTFTARFGQLFAQSKTKAALASEDHRDVPGCPLNLDTL